MKIHVVKTAEDMHSIAMKYSVGEEDLRRANDISAPGPLCPGQSLFIPGQFPEDNSAMEVCAISSSPAEGGCATYLCPYSHSFSKAGELISPGIDIDPAALRQEGCAPLLCLANLGTGGGFSPELAHLLFTDEKLKSRLLETVLSKLGANGYCGLMLCLNYLFPFDRDNYTDFVSELSARLHADGFLLFLELAPPDSPTFAPALDYEALGHYADRLSLMFCRWGHAFSPPQPPAPMPLLQKALGEVTSLIAPEKLLLGISGCGFDWKLPWHQGDRAQQISNSLAAELAMSCSRHIQFDLKSQTPYFDYSDAAARRHRLYFEDARSLEAKLRLVREYSLAGISLYSWERVLRPGNSMLQQLYCAEKLL